MKTLKNIAFFILLTIVINYVGFTILFEPVNASQITSKPLTLEPVSLYEGGGKTVSEAGLQCLTENIFHEARSESDRGKFAVAYVTINRLLSTHYPDKLCDVVYEPYQFSWTVEPQKVKHNSIESQAWNNAYKVALSALSTGVPDSLVHVTHFHTDQVQPNWSKSSKYKKIAQIDSHIFYRPTY